jgi:hypothetical protein
MNVIYKKTTDLYSTAVCLSLPVKHRLPTVFVELPGILLQAVV